MRKIILLLSTLACHLNAYAEQLLPLPAQLTQCAMCHGTQLMGNEDIGAPRLTDLPEWYVKNQLAAFKNGWRGTHQADHAGAEMLSVAKSMTPETFALAIAFISKTSSPLPKPTFTGDLTNGKQLYSHCVTCHGKTAQGNKAVAAPPLTGLHDWYIVHQLKHFKQGVRGSATDYVNGQLMKASAQVLLDEQAMIDVTAYILSMNSDKE